MSQGGTPQGSPLDRMREEQEEALRSGDPCASLCTLATVDDEGQPALRTLVLRGIEERGPIVFVNGTSPKVRHLQGGAGAEMLLFWPSRGIQYRLRGAAEWLPHQRVAASWRLKPRAAKLLDLFYERFQPQSSVLADRETLLRGIATLAEEHGEGEIEPPKEARGLLLAARRIESWHESPDDRLHRRVLWQLDGASWSCRPLVP